MSEWYVKRKGGIEFTAGDFSLKPNDTMGNIVSARRGPDFADAGAFAQDVGPEGPADYADVINLSGG